MSHYGSTSTLGYAPRYDDIPRTSSWSDYAVSTSGQSYNTSLPTSSYSYAPHSGYSSHPTSVSAAAYPSYSGTDLPSVYAGHYSSPLPTSTYAHPTLPLPTSMAPYQEQNYMQSSPSGSPYSGYEHSSYSPELSGQYRHRDYYCDYPQCDRTEGFTTYADLHRHRKSVHKIAGKYWVCRDPECPKFNKEFPRKDNLQDHLKRVHKLGKEERDNLADIWSFEKSDSS
ncbi:hypothetical protein BJ508DRAFT_379689 [Ascobolus immersus RN42]|uniref:C2H2-type domain-containing protein n=1 Tax=Ascobolus immersus RN42 TaxID=1160509 RepID=A0A3N4I2H1_ASCIM|nr:hypothetical protein BJ508DRAFT_379689 [Ascobolus immersus RN42]